MADATVTPRTWADALLGALGIPVTQVNEQSIVDWEASEGGAGPEWGIPNNETAFNPLNVSLTTGPQGYGYDPGTGQYFPGASPTPGNDPPIAAFSDWSTGLTATAARLEEPFAGGILSALRSGSENDVASAVGASGWGTGDFSVRGASGSASGSGPQGSATLASANAQQAGLNLNPFDLFGIPQSAASAVWSSVGPFLAKAMLVVAGLGIIGIGLYKTTDAGGKARQAAQEVPPEAAAAAVAA